jgi:hypothetical protein
MNIYLEADHFNKSRFRVTADGKTVEGGRVERIDWGRWHAFYEDEDLGSFDYARQAARAVVRKCLCTLTTTTETNV